MNFIKNFSGIIACFVVVISSLVCTTLAPDVIEEKDYVLSYFGKESQTQFIFNFSLILAGLFLMIFLNYLRVKLEISYSKVVLFSPAIFFMLVGVFSLDVNSFLHTLCFIAFIFSWFVNVILISKFVRKKIYASFLSGTSFSAYIILSTLFLADVRFWIWAEFVLGSFVLFQILILTDYVIFLKEKRFSFKKVLKYEKKLFG
ncbi:MAG: hypothetical protein KatS3mg085_461 [Candidatus Dojkabacteria bacterium]|nr:MAG: hypothetical protein KatS3mg085_461 [Candidatus Dojkabacteria bacterium]